MSAWIQTAEQMPRKYQRVIVWGPLLNSPLMGFLNLKGRWCSDDMESYVIPGVTHWQPMPEKPEGEEGAQ